MRLLTAKEVSIALQIPLARVYELTRRGVLPVLRLGDRQLRFELDTLREWAKRSSTNGCRADDSARESTSESFASTETIGRTNRKEGRAR